MACVGHCSKVEEEGGWRIPRGQSVEVVDGPGGENVGGVTHGIYLSFVQAHVVLIVPAVMVIVVHHVTEKPVEVIKAPRVWVGLVIEPKMPLSDRGG